MNNQRRGTILIVSMLVIFAIAGLALTMGYNARTDMQVAANELAGHQADAVERGAEQYVLAILNGYSSSLADITDQEMAAVPVGTGYFWIIRPNYNDKSLASFGLVDETSKLNINTASYDTLRSLSGMTDQIAGAIIDWRDADNDVSTNGAESADYSGLSNPYNAKNADFESIDELLLIKGMSEELLHGPKDISNQVISNYYQQYGLADFFTISTSQPNKAADGTNRININNPPDRGNLNTLLSKQLGATRGNEIIAAMGRNPFQDIFEFASKTNMKASELQLVEDNITTSTAQAPMRGKININTAPREVLVSLGVINESDVDSLLAARPNIVQSKPNTLSWVYDTLKERSIGLGNFITAQGKQYSAEIVAVSGNGRAFRHVKIIVDLSQTPPRVIFRQDMTDRGWPMDASLLQTMRSGQGPMGQTTGGLR